ncbi:MAG: hypothetical protein MJ252_18035 [archaeon]|nr:hypothetical protein [archaeon]
MKSGLLFVFLCCLFSTISSIKLLRSRNKNGHIIFNYKKSCYRFITLFDCLAHDEYCEWRFNQCTFKPGLEPVRRVYSTPVTYTTPVTYSTYYGPYYRTGYTYSTPVGYTYTKVAEPPQVVKKVTTKKIIKHKKKHHKE